MSKKLYPEKLLFAHDTIQRRWLEKQKNKSQYLRGLIDAEMLAYFQQHGEYPWNIKTTKP